VKRITVYCSSSTALEPHFAATARTLGGEIARRGLTLVYGGGGIGLMGEVARAAKAAGGRVEGVITRQFVALEQAWDGCDEMVVVDTMRERKAGLEGRADAFVVLPGGLGTFEELFEILVARYLGHHRKRIAMVNDRGYWDPLKVLLEHAIEHTFVRPAVLELLSFHGDPVAALDAALVPAGDDGGIERFLPQHGRSHGATHDSPHRPRGAHGG
jgi:uncharacterized protein (TIGR00730 family)